MTEYTQMSTKKNPPPAGAGEGRGSGRKGGVPIPFGGEISTIERGQFQQIIWLMIYYTPYRS